METRERIIFKALQYFTENDYEGASLDRIANAIGITKGGIYHYFDSKDDLFHECLVYLFSALKKVSTAMIRTDLSLEEMLTGIFSFEELFKALAGMFSIDLLNDYFNYAYLMFAGIKKYPDIKDMVADVYRDILDEAEQSLLRFQSEGEIDSSLDCKALAFELGSMMEGAMLIAGLNKDIDIKKLGRTMASNVLQSIRRR